MKIKNWEKFQHFKDRRPPWIKLYRDLLDDDEWAQLSGDEAKVLIGLWLLASENHGNLPPIKKIAFRLRLSEVKISGYLQNLSHWIVDGEQQPLTVWPSRYISRELRERIIQRDRNQCVFCSATKNLEVDHIIPVSKGGISAEQNLQLLCRSCNRTKRTRVANAEQIVATATPTDILRNPETETETETEIEIETETPIVPFQGTDAFDNFWEVYPRKVGKEAARKAWKKTRGIRPPLPEVLEAVRLAVSSEQWTKDNGTYIPNPATWLNQGRWSDVVTPKPKTLYQEFAERHQGGRHGDGLRTVLSGVARAHCATVGATVSRPRATLRGTAGDDQDSTGVILQTAGRV